jgi:hypothetical protein
MLNDNEQPLYHVGDLVVFTYPHLKIEESVGLIEFVDQDFYNDTFYGVIDGENTYIIRQPFIVRLAYE